MKEEPSRAQNDAVLQLELAIRKHLHYCRGIHRMES
jgi:hypothetical protein